MKWKKVEIGNLLKVTSGGTPSRKKIGNFKDGTIPWIKTGDLKVRHLLNAGEYITEEGLNSSSAKLFPKNTVLLAMYGATIGACSILKIEAATNQACAALLPNEKLNESFLYYFLKGSKQDLIRKGVGGAQPNISGGIIKKIKIPLPSIPIQKQIAKILDTADALRRETAAQLADLDALAQSVFLEMFGDAVLNEKGWMIKKIGECLNIKHGYAFKSEFFKKEGEFALLTPGHFYEKGGFKNLGIKQKFYIGDFSKEYLLKKGDQLIAMTEQAAGLLGSILFVPENDKFLHNQRLGLVQIQNDLIPIYLHYVMNSKSIRTQIHHTATGTKVRHTSPKKLMAINIPVPPLDLQTQFAQIIENIESQKAELQQSLQESEDLFNGLLQEVFG